MFQESILKNIVNAALAYRDNVMNNNNNNNSNENPLGDWSLIIDAIKEVIVVRRDLATSNFSNLIKYGTNNNNNNNSN